MQALTVGVQAALSKHTLFPIICGARYKYVADFVHLPRTSDYQLRVLAHYLQYIGEWALPDVFAVLLGLLRDDSAKFSAAKI
jgi:hypothetical protein